MATGTTPNGNAQLWLFWSVQLLQCSFLTPNSPITMGIKWFPCKCSQLPLPLRRGQGEPLAAPERRLCRRAIELEHKRSARSCPSLGWPRNCTGVVVLAAFLSYLWANAEGTFWGSSYPYWPRRWTAGCAWPAAAAGTAGTEGTAPAPARSSCCSWSPAKHVWNILETHLASVEGIPIGTGMIKSLRND